MSEQHPSQLSPILAFHPIPIGDPPPDVWNIIRQLDLRQQREVAAALLRSSIAMHEAQIEAAKQIVEIIAR